MMRTNAPSGAHGLQQFATGLPAPQSSKKSLNRIRRFTMHTSASELIITGEAKKTEFLHWIPFVHDSRAEGIRLLEIAAERANENRYAAISALISIELDAKNYEQVEYWSKAALKHYPDTRIVFVGTCNCL